MFHRGWQFCGSGLDRVCSMFFFLVTHLFDDRTTFGILRRQVVEVAVEVRAYLAFGLRNEAKAPLVPENATGRSDCKGTGVPERTQSADILTQFMKTLFAPGEVVEFLVGRTLHLCLDRLVARHCGVPLVERLCGDLAGMVDAHEPGCVPLLTGVEIGIDEVRSGIVPGGRSFGRRGYGPQGIVGAGEQAVQRRQLAFFHGRNYSETKPFDGILRSLFCPQQ